MQFLTEMCIHSLAEQCGLFYLQSTLNTHSRHCSVLKCATVTLVKKTWFAYGQSRAICTALGKEQPGSLWPPSDFQRLDVVVGRLCLKAILMWSTTREEKILGTRRRAHLHYGSWRKRQVHCGSWRQSQCLFPTLYRTMRSGKPWLFVG